MHYTIFHTEKTIQSLYTSHFLKYSTLFICLLCKLIHMNVFISCKSSVSRSYYAVSKFLIIFFPIRKKNKAVLNKVVFIYKANILTNE